MFYAHFVLSKKGPLARIWLAAHWDKKLTKAHVFETNIEGSVEAIIQPKVKLALRTSGHLLLGVVRIYSRKAKYLLADCNEAFVKIKLAFRPGVVDLPEENREAAVASITLPETFHDFDTTMAELSDLDVQAQFAVNQSRPEEITMREDLGNITLVGDDGFGDMGFDAGPNIIQDAHMDDTLYVRSEERSSLLLNTSSMEKSSTEKPMDIDLPQPGHQGNFEDGIADFEGPPGVEDDDDDDNDFGGGVDDDLFGDNFVGEGGGLFEEPPVPEVPLPTDAPAIEKSQLAATEQDVTQAPEQTTTVVPDQTTLIPDEAEAFHLEPVDVTTLGTERRAKRKRKLIVDDQKGIPSETMKLQLSDTSDIVTTLDLAPPTKKLKYWKETGGVEKLFALPGRPMVSRRVIKLFNRNLVTKPRDDAFWDGESLELDHGEPQQADETQQQQQQQQQQEQQQPPHLAAQLGTDQLEAAVEETPLPQLDITETELPRIPGDSRLEDLQDMGPALDDLSSLAMEKTISNNVMSPSLTRSRLQDDDDTGGISSDDDNHEEEDDIFDADLPPPTMEQESELQEDGQDAEELEEKRWSRRTQQMIHVVNKHLKTQSTASFKEIISGNNRKQVASKFYTLLVLKKMQAIDVEQSKPYGDIAIVPGPKMGLAF